MTSKIVGPGVGATVLTLLDLRRMKRMSEGGRGNLAVEKGLKRLRWLSEFDSELVEYHWWKVLWACIQAAKSGEGESEVVERIYRELPTRPGKKPIDEALVQRCIISLANLLERGGLWGEAEDAMNRFWEEIGDEAEAAYLMGLALARHNEERGRQLLERAAEESSNLRRQILADQSLRELILNR